MKYLQVIVTVCNNLFDSIKHVIFRWNKLKNVLVEFQTVLVEFQIVLVEIPIYICLVYYDKIGNQHRQEVKTGACHLLFLPQIQF